MPQLQKFFKGLSWGLLGLAVLLSSASASVIDRPFLRMGAVVIVWSASDFFEEDFEAPLVHDFVLLDNVTPGSEGADIIEGDGVPVNFPFIPTSNGEEAGWPFQITGQTFGGVYNNNPSFQLLDAADSYTAFDVNNNTDIDLLGANTRFGFFFVTSNTAFDIYAQANNLSATGDFTGLGYENITFNLLHFSPTSPTIGGLSQDPSVGGAGVVIGANGQNSTLDDLTATPTKVFDGGRRTARSRGSIAQQAVGFAPVYQLRGAPINGNNYDLSLGVGKLGAEVIYTIYAP